MHSFVWGKYSCCDVHACSFRQYTQLRSQMEVLEKEMYGYNKHRASFGCQVSGDDLSYFNLNMASKASTLKGDYPVRPVEHSSPLKTSPDMIEYGTDRHKTHGLGYDKEEETMMREIESGNGEVTKGDHSTRVNGVGPSRLVRNRSNNNGQRESIDIEMAPIEQNGRKKQITPIESLEERP